MSNILGEQSYKAEKCMLIIIIFETRSKDFLLWNSKRRKIYVHCDYIIISIVKQT